MSIYRGNSNRAGRSVFSYGFLKVCRVKKQQVKSRSLDVQRDIDIATRRFGVRAHLIRSMRDIGSDLLGQPRQAYVESSLQEIGVPGLTEIDLDIDGDVGRNSYLQFFGGKTKC